MTQLERMEAKLGENIRVITDKLDLAIRQGNITTIRALNDITEVWQDIALLMNAERQGAIRKLTFNTVHDGHSVVDTLMHYAIEMFPRSATAKRNDTERNKT